ncbi:MAG: EamA/RhaT family transporter, partial [Pseudomonadota bacterium]
MTIPMNDRSRGTLLMVAAVFILSPDALLISLVKTGPWVLVFWRGLLTSCTLTCALFFSCGTKTAQQFMRMGRA